MRRIYESEALHRDDEDAFSPNEHERRERPQAFRWVNASLLSRLLLPRRLRNWAISVRITTPREEYPVGTAVPFRVTMKNALPVPVSIRTDSPHLWTWTVDDHPEASHVPVHRPPETNGAFRFDRGEHKRFSKRWQGLFRVSETEWERAGPGTYTIGAALNVPDAEGKGLYDETTVRLVPE
ncbi:hypothetical protein [Natronorarus salvus]|uniref:hypothetical protein n=1 Tax=Natronorarus salvus TaxID=3117733 RepID=UPI002F26DD1A